MLNNISVRTRLFLLSAIPVITLVITVIFSYAEMRKLNQGIDSLYFDRVVALNQLKRVSDAYAVTSVDTFHKHKSGIMDKFSALNALEQASQTAQVNWQAYLGTQLTSEERSLIQQVETHLTPFLRQFQLFRNGIENDSFHQLSESAFNNQLYSAADPLSAALDNLIVLQLTESDKFRQTAEANFSQFTRFFAIVIISVIVLLMIIAKFIYSSINTPLTSLRTSIEQVGQHLDLRVRVNCIGRDELAATGNTFNHTLEKLQGFFAELGGAIQQMATASEQMHSISIRVSNTADEQSHKATLIATAVTEMSAAIQEVAGNALATSEQANTTDTLSQQGYQSVRDNVAAINQLSSALVNSAEIISNLNQESDKISQVLAVIRSIAEQTNLLALNAAIEAARAGEAGRGFAVVADEVRTLATSTQQATESIKIMIENLQRSSKSAVSSMQASEQYAQLSVDKAGNAGTIIENIKNSISTIVDMNVQISTATEEQTIVADDISRNISDFTVSIGEVSRSARESSTASEMLAHLAAKLQTQARAFKV
ncbi:chemotaxis transducer [Alishewanella longhuensis]|uniref:Chemotaxis transducer n=1 Tax=Alishewanella longhuensis TaxID=1091037 RepID=A0ABQ3KWI6_9ALTE|nr:methyl-accepting chemotaxis protein [Alishewanella longhuensis]GHG63014.1 chemotaxis transducer [Alishewanella longhuensis]